MFQSVLNLFFFFFSPSGLGSETIIYTALLLIATICLDCTAMSLTVLLLAAVPWPQWHPKALLMGIGAVKPFACHWHFPASNTLPHLPPLLSSSSCSQAFGKLCGTGNAWKPRAFSRAMMLRWVRD